MLDIGFPEFLLISFVLLIVVGPKDLPKVLRSITSFVRKIKSMASQFHSGIDDLANEAEISDLRKEVNKIDKKSLIDDHVGEIKELEDDVDIKSIKNDVDDIKNASNEKIDKNSKSKIKNL
jgi:sec-independent protein translocase protein TatB